jgi:hypothetical protein
VFVGIRGVTLTQLCLPRTFLEQIRFTQTVRTAASLPTDPDLLRIFQKLAPQVDWSRLNDQPSLYVAPRWIGYWYSAGTYWISDGVLKLAAPAPDLVREFFQLVQRTHFSDRTSTPFSAEGQSDPTHMILHDSDLWRVYVSSFEQGEATLVRQPRNSL